MIRTICGVAKSTSCRQLFKDCKILTITSLYVFEVLYFLKNYKMAVQKSEKIHDHNTRTNMDLYIKPRNTSLYKKSIINIGI